MAASSSPSYRSTQALIVGGGIHGCSLALNLALRGVECAVIEKDYVARHASGVNGGGVRTLGRHLAEITLALKSAALWRDMDSLLDQPCGLRVSGNIRLAENEQDLEKLSRRVRELQSLGFWHERMVDPSELRSIAPAVSRHCLGGLYVAEDGFANPFTVTSAFRARAAAKGATFVEGTRVTGVDVQAGGWAVQTDTGAWRSRWLFNCAGGWSQQLAQRMGDPLPIRADGSMQIVTARMPAFLQPVVGSASRSVSIKQWPNGTVTIGGGHRAAVNLATGQSSIRPEKLSLAAASAAALFPCLRQAQAVRFWSGIEAFTPDGLPIIDRGSQEGAFHVTGFSAHGFQLAPIVGQLVARWAVEGTMPALLAPFSRTRFSRSSPATSSH